MVWFSETSVNVSAGAQARASVAQQAFELTQAPTSPSPTTLIQGDAIQVTWGTLNSAASYLVEWSTDATFASGVQSVETSASLASVPLGTPGIYTVRVSPMDASDRRGAPRSVASTFTVVANTVPVVAIATPSQDTTVVAGLAVTLTATASDVEDGNLSTSVTWTSSLAGPLGTGTTVTPALTTGTHTIVARVQDTRSAFDTDTVVVTVVTNTPPNAAFIPSCTQLACGFTDQSTDNGAIVSRSWTFGDGGTSALQNPNHTYAAGGVYSVRLIVTDNFAAADTATQSVTANTTPMVAIATPGQDTTAVAGSAVTLSATAIDTEDGDLSAAVTWTSSLAGPVGTGATVTPTLAAGVHTIVARVQDALAGVDTDTVVVTVVPDPPPNAAFAFSCSELVCGFTDQSTDNGTITSRLWTFGDGGASTLQHPPHTYAAGGVYPVRLIVTDNLASADTITQSVPVIAVTFSAAHGAASGTDNSPRLDSISVSGANRLLICVIASGRANDNPPSAVSGVAFTDSAGNDPQSMTQLGNYYSAPADGGRLSTWYLVGPITGANRSVRGARTATPSGEGWSVLCVSYAGVDQAAPFGAVNTASGNSGTASLQVTANTDRSLPWAFLFTTNGTYTAVAGVVPRQPLGAGAALVDGAMTIASLASHVFVWTYNGEFGAQGATIRPQLTP